MFYIKKSLLIFLSLCLLIQIQWVSAQNFSRYDSLLRIYEVNRNLGVNKEIQIKNLIDLSTEITLSNPDKAIQFLQTAIQLAQEIGNKQKEAEISGLLGDLFLEKMFVFSAMDSYLKSYLIYRDAGQLKEMAWALINIGNVSYAQHIYDYPMQNYRQAYNIFSQINHQYGMSVVLNNLGMCKREMLELDSALYYMNQALQLREKLGNSLHVVYSLTYIASVYLKKQDYTKTLETIDKAMSLLNSVYPKENREADELRISLYILKGEVRFSQGDDVSALQNLNSGLQIAENLKSDRYKVEILSKLVMVYQGKADFLQAIEINKQRIALCRKINLIDCTIEAYRKMGELYNRIGVFDSAIQNYRKSLYYSDSIRFVWARSNFYDIGQAFRIYSLEQQEKVILQRMQRGQLFIGVGIVIILITGIFLLIHFRRIRNARREFETLSEAAFEGIVLHDRGLILSTNSRFSQMLKMTPEVLKGKDLYDFVVENDRQRAIELSRDNRNEVNYQTQLSGADHTVIDVEILSKPFIYRGKKVRVGAVRDITEHQKLIQENLILREAIRQMAVSLVLTNDVGDIIYVNPFFTSITGYTLDEAKGKNPRILKSGYHSNAFYKDLWDTITQGRVWTGELYNKKKDGTFYWEKAVISPVKDASGKITHFVAIKEDITLMKNQEHELRQRNLMYRYLAKNLPDTAVLVFNKDLICILSEGPVLKELGFSANNFEGASLRQFLPDARREELSQKLESVFKDEGSAFDTTINQRNYQVVIVPMKDDNNQIFQGMIILTDITEKLLKQEILKKSEGQLKIAVATKDRFISILAHDLRSPFASILGLCDVLLDDYHQLDDEVKIQYIHMIRNSSSNVLELLNNLLSWSRAQSGMIEFRPRVFNITSFIKDIVSLMSLTAAQKNISLLTDIPHDVDIYADPDILGTILRNLVSNAVKYSYPGGEVMISVIIPHHYSAVQPNGSDCWMVFSVADTGMGMTQEELSQLFLIDDVTSKEGTNHEKGTGLGLLLVKELVDKMRGHIHVESQSGQGTKFYVEIPCEFSSNKESM